MYINNVGVMYVFVIGDVIDLNEGSLIGELKSE